MKYELFSSLYAEALGYAGVDMFIGERGWQDWMDDYSAEQVADMLQDIYFLAHDTIRVVREKHGYSRAAFARLFNVPIRTNEDWDKDPKLIKNYVKISICYALFESKFYERREKVMKAYNELKEFIEEDIAEKGIGHGEIADFDPQQLLNGETIMTASSEFGPKHNKIKVAISLSDINFENAIDVYIADFGTKEVNVYYLDD